MTISASDIIRGPAIIFIGATAIYTEGDIETVERIETFDISTAMFGPQTDQRVDAILQEISFTPSGDWAYRTALLPYLNPTIGSSIFTGQDVHIHTAAGVKKTLHNAAITQMPSLIFSTNKELFGDVTITAIGADNTAWSDAAKRQSITSEAFSDTSFDPDNIITQDYAVSWGASSPWDDIESEEGVTIEFDLQLEPVTTDSQGIVDMSIANLGVTARLMPVGVTEAEMLALLKIQGAGMRRGRSLRNNINDLVIAGASNTVRATINQASPVAGPTRYGQTTLRHGELGFNSVREFSMGAVQPMVVLDTNPV